MAHTDMNNPHSGNAVTCLARALLVAVCGMSLVLSRAPLAAKDIPGGHALTDLVRTADEFYLGRHNPENVRQALSLVRQTILQNPRDYEAWWRVSKFSCYLARHASGREKQEALEEGITAGRRAVLLEPNRAEGHFWLGANYGLMAEAGGFWKGLQLVDRIRGEMEAVVKLDPDYEQGAALRTLARIYYRAPFFKGGDKRRSVTILEECLKRFPDNSLTRLYLADSLLALGRRNEAREQLEAILRLCPDPMYGPELAENQQEARTRLGMYFRAKR